MKFTTFGITSCVIALVAILLGGVLWLSIWLVDSTSTKTTVLDMASAQILEKAYMAGQKDYMEGKHRVYLDKADDCWKWTESPWDSGRVPTYIECKGE